MPGWTTLGHPGYFGYAWYRIRVQVLRQPGQARQGAGLALAGPAHVDDAYEVFDNGELAGHFGDFNGGRPVVYFTQPKMFPLAQAGSHKAISGQDRAGQGETGPGETAPAESTLVVAFRLWMEPYTLLDDPEAGGMHSAPVLGQADAVAASYQVRWLALTRSYAFAAILALLFGLLGVVAFSLILFDRSDRVYLWMGALFLLIAANSGLKALGSWTELQSIPVNDLLVDVSAR